MCRTKRLTVKDIDFNSHDNINKESIMKHLLLCIAGIILHAARIVRSKYDDFRVGCLVVLRRRKENVIARFVTDVQLDVEAIQDYLSGGGTLYLYDESRTARIACEGRRGKKVRYDAACQYAEVADVQVFQTGHNERKVLWRGV